MRAFLLFLPQLRSQPPLTSCYPFVFQEWPFNRGWTVLSFCYPAGLHCCGSLCRWTTRKSGSNPPITIPTSTSINHLCVLKVLNSSRICNRSSLIYFPTESDGRKFKIVRVNSQQQMVCWNISHTLPEQKGFIWRKNNNFTTHNMFSRLFR